MYKTLVADDEEGIVTVLSEWLTSQGHQVSRASSGDSAIRLIAEVKPDLVITDISMQPVDGFQVLRAAKKQDPLMAVVMITGHRTAANDAMEAMGLGADDYICKPFSLQDLGRRVDNVLKYREKLRSNDSVVITEPYLRLAKMAQILKK